MIYYNITLRLRPRSASRLAVPDPLCGSEEGGGGGGRDARGAAPHDFGLAAFSATPLVPSLRASSARTSCGSTPTDAQSTMR